MLSLGSPLDFLLRSAKGEVARFYTSSGLMKYLRLLLSLALGDCSSKFCKTLLILD